MKTENKVLSEEKYAQAAQWLLQLRETNNDHFMPFFFDRHRFLVLCGGGGSGKSIFAGRKILERCVTEAGHRMLVVRYTEKSLRQSCFSQLQAQARRFYEKDIAKITQNPMRITFRNGSEILFSGLDDVEKLKSIFGITGIWIEEASEITESDFNQLNIRMRDATPYYQQFIITFNPISVTHWLKKRFFDRSDPDVTADRSTYLDNRFLSGEAVRTLLSFRDSDPYYYMVYALGEWGITGKTVFDRALIAKRLEKKEKPVAVGCFDYRYDGMEISDISFARHEDVMLGVAQLFEKPKPGYPYVIGADTAGDGSDWFVAYVLNNHTGKQAAILRMHTDEDLFARQIYCMGKYYNDALIGVETNFSTYPIRELERLGYTNQYVRQIADTYTGAFTQAFGYQTNAKTRPLMIANMIRQFRENPECVCDEETLAEMSTFVRTPSMRAEAESGAHDDCVMAAAIALMIRDQQDYAVEKQEKKTVWTQDMWEDWNNASEEERKIICRVYGEPEK